MSVFYISIYSSIKKQIKCLFVGLFCCCCFLVFLFEEIKFFVWYFSEIHIKISTPREILISPLSYCVNIKGNTLYYLIGLAHIAFSFFLNYLKNSVITSFYPSLLACYSKDQQWMKWFKDWQIFLHLHFEGPESWGTWFLLETWNSLRYSKIWLDIQQHYK